MRGGTHFAIIFLLAGAPACTQQSPVTHETRSSSEATSPADADPQGKSVVQSDSTAPPAPPVPPVIRNYPSSAAPFASPTAGGMSAPATPSTIPESHGAASSTPVAAAPTQHAGLTSVGPQGNVTDLLQIVDTNRDAIRGRWLRQDATLSSPGGLAILAVPFTPPRAYRWTVVVERVSGNDSLGLVIPVGSHRTMVVLEGWQEKVSGLNLVAGTWAYDNPTTNRKPVFNAGSPTTVVCTVQESAVNVVCDGQTIINWAGSASDLSLDLRYWSDAPPGRLAVTVYDPQTRFRITKMLLEPLEGSVGVSTPTIVQGGTPNAAKWPPAVPTPAGRDADSADERGLPEAATQRKESVALVEHPLGSGTGFVVGDNLLVTNAHVVAGSFVDEIEIHFPNEGAVRHRPRRILYHNELCDLCILDVDTRQPAIPLPSDHAMESREPVVLIGNPSLAGGMMLRNAVTGGTITALMRIDGYDFYQIDANVNPGSSGGPVLNYRGDLVAVVAMKATDEGEIEIREAIEQLDDTFAAQFRHAGERQKGIAFGIPVSGLSRALQQVAAQSETVTSQIDAHHASRTLFERLAFLAAFRLLEMQVNVPAAVRQQARQIEQRGLPARSLRIPKNKLKFAELLPAQVADRVASGLRSERVRTLLRVYSNGLDDRLARMRENNQADEAITRRLAELLRLVKQAERAAANPPADYQSFSQKLLTLNDDMADLVEQTADAIDDLQPTRVQ